MESQEYTDRVELNDIRSKMEEVKSEIRKVIVGQDQMIELLLAAILARGHVLIEGFPGLAKTLTAKLLAKTMSTEFTRIQFTPDLMPSDILGTSVYNFKTSEFDFKKGPLFSQVILIDEINRAPAKTQSALFEVMEERQISIEGERYPMKEPFMIIATQNPIDMEGTYQLPEAQMDRFLFKINVGYPVLKEEKEILKRFHEEKSFGNISSLNPVLSEAEIEDFQIRVKGIHVEEKLLHFIAEIVNKSRSFPDIMLGGSPRASLAMLSGSKALALIRGRDFIIPDDILDTVSPVMNHRIIISPEKEMEGSTSDKVIRNLIQQMEVPR